MTMSLMLLYLAGAVTLLLWAVRMVRTGVERAHGAALRRAVGRAGAGRLRAAATGALVAIVLQSSTAVAILCSGFAAAGIIGLPAGLALLLGADLGSALVVQLLSLNLSWLMPACLTLGGWMFLKGSSRGMRQSGRILVGIALILLSLKLIGEATAPLRDSEFLPLAVDYLSGDFLTAFLLGALFSWLVHSSIATVLLFMVLAGHGALPLEPALYLTLGANLGGALTAATLTRATAAEARRLPLGNLAFRGAAAVAALFLVQSVELPLHLLGAEPARQVANFHLAFNATLLAFLPLTGLMARLLRRLVVDARPADADPRLQRPSALDRAVIATPSRALASATRELLRISEIVEIMLRPVMECFETGDKERIRQIRRLDDEVDKATSQVKTYLVQVGRNAMSAEEARQCLEVTSFAVRLEHAADIVVKDLLRLAEKKTDAGVTFSAEGWRELTDLHERVVANMQLALNVLVSGDRDSARQLVAEKDRLRALEWQSNERHLARLRSGEMQSIETSEIHLETIRHLKQVNSLFASVAYPILDESGDLLESRLAQAL